MNKLLRTILILSIAVFGFGSLFVPSISAQNNNLVVEFETDPLPLFSVTNFLPGESVSGWVRVTNNSGQTQRIAIEAVNENDSDGLDTVLNLKIKQGSSILYNNTLSRFFNTGEVYLSNLANNITTQYDFTVTFDSGAGNQFQGKSLRFDLLVGFQGTEGALLPGAVLLPGVSVGIGGFLSTIIDETVRIIDIRETSVTITWQTNNYFSTSQVIYAKEGEKRILDLTDNIGIPPYPPKYGYAHTTREHNISPRITFHSVTLTGLTPGTIYYFRAVSRTPLTISREYYFTTLRAREEELIPAEEIALAEEEIPVPEEMVGPPEEIEEEVPEEIVPPEEEIVIVPPEERIPPERGLAPALLASLAFSWQDFLEGQIFNNLIFWGTIAVLGILLYGLSLIKKPRMFFRAIGFIGVFGLLIATLLLPLPIIDQLRMPLPNFISYLVGILLFVGGILIMFLAIKALSFKTASGIDESKELVTSGLYGVVRHPLYLGLIIAYLGWCIIFKALPALLMAPIVFIFLWILTIFEEKDLLKTFGENYIQYKRRVFKRMIPKVI